MNNTHEHFSKTQNEAIKCGRIEFDDNNNETRFSLIGARTDTLGALLRKGAIVIIREITYFSSHTKSYNFGRKSFTSTIQVIEPVYMLTDLGRKIRSSK
jgi:hypothetical protein